MIPKDGNIRTFLRHPYRIGYNFVQVFITLREYIFHVFQKEFLKEWKSSLVPAFT